MEFYLPTRVYQEEDAVLKHSKEMASYGKKALIVTGSRSSRENGALSDVTEGLEKNHTAYVIYDKVMENPTVDCVMEAAEMGRSEGCDFVVGIGGGSPLDASKAVALMLQNRDSGKEVLYQEIALRHLPVVAVPTTCGTGSEVTQYAVLTRKDLQTKQSIRHSIFPELALVDGKYLKKAPLSVLVHTSVDALAHMLESYFHADATDYSRMIAQYAMEVWSTTTDFLFGAEAGAEDYGRMMFASSLAGMAIAHTSTSLPHGLSYYLTCHKNIPHGKAVAVFLPEYLHLLSEDFEPQVTMALRALGFGSLAQFEGVIRELLGRVELTEQERNEMAEQIAGNEKKCKAAPFTVTREKIDAMVSSVL